MEQRENIIELKHITKTFEDGFHAVEDFNLEVKRGEFVTFLGPSGCGKTTTLRMIAGFDVPTEGEILLNGKSITDPCLGWEKTERLIYEIADSL